MLVSCVFALVYLCRQCSPGLWKELAKEVVGSKSLLDGFLEAAATLALISDHRTQELVFEALYRLWKVCSGRIMHGTRLHGLIHRKRRSKSNRFLPDPLVVDVRARLVLARSDS